MSPTGSAASRRSAREASESRGQGYTIAGIGLVVALTLVVVIGLAGVVGIGLLSPGEAFFVLGAGMTVLGVAMAGMLFSMHRTFKLLQDQQAKIDGLQNAQFRAVSEEQGRTDRSQKREIAQLRSRLATKDASTNGGDGPSEGSPFGDVHPVIDIKGIGEGLSRDLRELSIVDTEQLWRADPDVVARALDIPRKTVRSWQRMSELIALNDVEPQDAELLVRARISSIEQLAEMTPAEVADAVQKVEGDHELRIHGNRIHEKHTRPWVEAARHHDPLGVRIER